MQMKIKHQCVDCLATCKLDHMQQTTNKPRAIVSWSGGKDCCLALHRARERFEIVGLIAVLTGDGSRNRSHGLRSEILRRQAEELGLPLLTARATWQDYDKEFKALLAKAGELNMSHVIFGDVFPAAHKQWAETISRAAGLQAVEPLWDESTYALAAEFIRSGGEAVIVAVCEDKLEVDWLGKILTVEMLNQLCRLGLDPGGENGEFHTVVRACPDFRSRIALTAGDTLSHGGYSLLDLVVD